jgi:translation initiation factor IF-2
MIGMEIRSWSHVCKAGEGLDDLLGSDLCWSADNMDILANPDGSVIGTVIEAERDRAKGVLVTLLVQNGIALCGRCGNGRLYFWPVRAMFDYRGRKVRKAGPSTPVSVMGMNDVPQAGDLFRVVSSEREARCNRRRADPAEISKEKAQKAPCYLGTVI